MCDPPGIAAFLEFTLADPVATPPFWPLPYLLTCIWFCTEPYETLELDKLTPLFCPIEPALPDPETTELY